MCRKWAFVYLGNREKINLNKARKRERKRQTERKKKEKEKERKKERKEVVIRMNAFV